ncbi:thymidylate synthase [Coxiella endosymbiont of Amblyomma sculptum]|uniref:thymidylate synthase n=1 Tax=Coxiella endosymbiont of Amblyomma sculptum TaxID=2487929 RepID=UPI00132EA54A|nr:thymidylate synthase [Coxiella endosymbiont of Amblyomma sculptum]QHG92285.1 thymidylate synthase [Coxiella endosymbiont of Amblyomma sculptum]
MQQYLDFLNSILEYGVDRKDRTGVGTRSIFGYEMRFNIQKEFPLVTTKKVHLKSVIYELLWFLKGDTNVRYLNENGVTIWNEWANENGELGPIYGKQWRSWQCANGRVIDQMKWILETIKIDPNSRRLVVSAWNVAELDQMALQPCHLLFQFYVANGLISCKLIQRSADAFLGVPFNIASYALLTHMIAEQCNLGVGEFIWSGGDCHIYNSHFDQIHQQLLRLPRKLPKLVIKRKSTSLFDYAFSDFEIIDYDPYPSIKAQVAI